MPAYSSPYQRFRAQTSTCLAAVLLLCIGQWRWVASVAHDLESVPQQSDLTGRQRTLAQRFGFSVLGMIQAPTLEDRALLDLAQQRARRELTAMHAQLAAHRLARDEPADPLSDQVTFASAHPSLERLLHQADTLMTARRSERRGALTTGETATFLATVEAYVSAIDRVNAADVAWADARLRTLDRTQLAGVLLVMGVIGALVLLVLRPTAARMGALSDREHEANEQLTRQAEALQRLSDAQNLKNHALQQHLTTIEAHQEQLAVIQAAIAEREQRYRSVVEAVAEGVLLLEDTEQLVAWNSSATRILGVGDEEMAGRRQLDVAWDFRDEQGAPLSGRRNPLVTTLRTGTPHTDLLVSFQPATGNRRWLRVNTRLIETVLPAGATRRSAVASIVDITDERRTADQLQLFSVAMQQTEQGIALADANLCVSWVNPAWSRCTGFSLDEAAGQCVSDLLHGPHTSAETIERMRAALRAGESWSGEVLNYSKAGTPKWIELSTTPLRDTLGVITSWVTVQRDVTERKAGERERQMLAAALSVTADGVGIISVGGGLEFVNHAYARVHQERPRALIGQPWSQRFPAEEALRIEREIIPQVTRLGAWSGEVTGKRADGTAFPQGLSITLLPTGGLVCVMRDATDAKHAEQILRTQASRDELTGLLNRRGFFVTGNQQLLDAEHRKMRSVLLFADADRFKQINDTYGHDVGDRVLQAVAAVLRNNLRASDVLSRLGGDEFTALLINTPIEHAHVVIAKIERALAALGEADGCPCPITLSIGVAAFDPASPQTLDALLRAADTKLYAVKQSHHRARAA